MTTQKSSRAFGRGRIWRKSLVSGFVLASYLAYAAHERLVPPAQTVAAAPPSTQSGQAGQAQPQDPAAPSTSGQGQAAPSDSGQSQAAPSTSGQDQAAPTTPAQDQATPTAPAQDPAASATAPQTANSGQYKNGTYTGLTANAFYGQVQVRVTISNGRIASVTFLNYPQDRRTSARINSFAVPQLQAEAIQAQSANVDIVSGATLTSEAFMQSMQSALDRAQG